MYVYIKSEPTLWTVGFYSPNGTWQPESDHSAPEDAANRVHYLNGSKESEEEPVLRQLSGYHPCPRV